MDEPLTVLIVDDDVQILRLVERMLGARRVKVNVLLAPRPSKALEICAQQSVALLISDITMPEMDGLRLAERVLKLQPGVQVLLISGNYKEMPPGIKSDRVHFLRKPFFPSEVVEHLRELLPDE